MKNKYPTFDITPQHLGQVIRDNNKTRKRTRHEHFPKERYKKPIEKQNELNKFYNRVKQFPMNKIICLDETSAGSALKPTYSRFLIFSVICPILNLQGCKDICLYISVMNSLVSSESCNIPNNGYALLYILLRVTSLISNISRNSFFVTETFLSCAINNIDTAAIEVG